MIDELKQEMTEKFNSAYGEEVKIGLREALRKIYIDGCEHGYQYAIDKACEWLNTHSETDYFELIPDANYCGAGKLNKKKMIDDFRKAMED